ncbi:HAMP domain-containing sensor histidine kinase [Dactylosporangium fulvum]|uniref:histidine kinase n=1 Tax=Dactylosporangium fulvum TaxID=53359 RepID=A0ABY5VPC1_9ACTN|nr:sensor histidine kinase [Dactylosporangium fulvum]UWP79002.1 sensor histidine kinase [Dactylosporangium fulvum]
MSLFWRIFLLNAAVLVVAMVVLILTPLTVSAPVLLPEVLILTGGLVAMLVANAVLLRVGLRPLDRLTRAMTTIDLLRPGRRLTVTGEAGIADLIRTFNTMLDRLEAERAASTGRALSAQEAERQRIARELHDEIGQTLTAVLLELKSVADHAPPPVSERLHQVQETTRNGLDEIRRIARRLRPGVLEELGLTSALKALAAEFSTGGLTVQHSIQRHADLGRDVELVLYRVAQECLTNTARHAGARHVDLRLTGWGTGVELCIRDDGRGPGDAPEGAGIRGMRERALLIGADLALGPAVGGGTEVRLRVPAPAESE